MENWDSKMVLNKYIYNYMKKRNFFSTAEIFAAEANISLNAVAIDSDEGFLTEWWSVFWSVFNTSPTDHEEVRPQSIPCLDPNRTMFDMWPAVPPVFRPLPPRVGPSITKDAVGSRNESFPRRSDIPRMIPTSGLRFSTPNFNTTSGMHGKGKLTLPNWDLLGRDKMVQSSSNNYPSDRAYKNPQLCLSKNDNLGSGCWRSTITDPARYPPKSTGLEQEQLRLSIKNSNVNSQRTDVARAVRLGSPSSNFCHTQEKIPLLRKEDDNRGVRYLPIIGPIKIGSSDAVPQSSVPVPGPGPATLIPVVDVRRVHEQEHIRVLAKNTNFNPDRVSQLLSSSPIDCGHAHENKKRPICDIGEDKCVAILKSSIAAGELQIEPLDFSAASISEQGHYGVPQMDLDSNAQLLNVGQLSRLLSAPTKFNYPQQNARKKEGQRCYTRDEGLVGTTSRGSVAAEPTHQAPKAIIQPNIQPTESGSSASSNSRSSGSCPSQ